MIGGSDETSIRQMQKPQPGDYVLAYEPGAGYVGMGQVTAAAVPQREFMVTSEGKRLVDLPVTSPPDPEVVDDPSRSDWCMAVEWLKTVDREEAILRHRAYRGTLCKIHQADLIEQVMQAWDLELPELAQPLQV